MSLQGLETIFGAINYKSVLMCLDRRINEFLYFYDIHPAPSPNHWLVSSGPIIIKTSKLLLANWHLLLICVFNILFLKKKRLPSWNIFSTNCVEFIIHTHKADLFPWFMPFLKIICLWNPSISSDIFKLPIQGILL